MLNSLKFLVVGSFSIMLCNFLFRDFDSGHMLLASGTSYLLGCPNDSCYWCYLHKENELHFSCKNGLPIRSYIHGRTGKSAHIYLFF